MYLTTLIVNRLDSGTYRIRYQQDEYVDFTVNNPGEEGRLKNSDQLQEQWYEYCQKNHVDQRSVDHVCWLGE